MAEKTLDEIKADISHRAGRINPFERVKKPDVEQVLRNLSSLDANLWGREWGKFGVQYEALGDAQEKQGKKKKPARPFIWPTSIIASAAIRCRAARRK